MIPDIVGIGLSTIDHLYLVEDVSKLPEGALLDYTMQGGGLMATAMAAAATIGASCGAITTVGDDAPGRDILAGLEACGVDVSRSLRCPGWRSHIVMVLTDARTGNRHFLEMGGRTPRFDPDRIDWDYVAQAKILHCDTCVNDVAAVLRKAKGLGLTVLVDAGMEAGLSADWVQSVDVFIGSGDRPEWRGHRDKALSTAREISARGPHTAILTLGAAGCVGVSADGEFDLPAYKVDVVDTTGTGDVFHGAYAYALVQGWRAQDCAQFASAAGAISATKLGGRAGLVDAKTVARFIASRGDHGPWDSA